MKKLHFLRPATSPIGPAQLALAMLLASCVGGSKTSEEGLTETFCYADSCPHLTMSLSLELPVGSDSAALRISDTLVAEFVRGVIHQGCYDMDDTIQIPPYRYKRDDVQALVDHYGRATYEHMLKLAMEDYKSRMDYLAEDTTMTPEERERISSDIPQWALDYVLQRITDTPTFAVYDAQEYCYFGGAHGGVVGAGPITFDKTTGRRVSQFLREDAKDSLQPIIRKGLQQYYRESGDTLGDSGLMERLMLLDDEIPLPQHALKPNATADSLTFSYGAYEIVCYADGMPAFTVSVQELAPFLTPEAKALLRK